MEKPEIIKVLDNAELAHRAGDFVNALKFYEHFFDHALDDDPYALYGVRLSYCLAGWGRLAQEFVGARQRLEQKQQEVLQQYQLSKVPETFHDYYCISHYLNRQEESLQQFLTLYSSSSKSASKLIKFVWEDLVAAEQWEICNQFLLEPMQKLDELFSVFDESARLKDVDASFDSDEFEQHTLNALVKGVSDLLLILRHNGRGPDVEDVQRQFYATAHARNHSGLNTLIQAKGSFLFGGH
ncbi:MAG: hypothetical protein ACRBHB_05845 [Arenicella sp.]